MRILRKPLRIQHGQGPFADFLGKSAKMFGSRIMKKPGVNKVISNPMLRQFAKTKIGKQLLHSGKSLGSAAFGSVMNMLGNAEDNAIAALNSNKNKLENKVTGLVGRKENELKQLLSNQTKKGQRNLDNLLTGNINRLGNLVSGKLDAF